MVVQSSVKSTFNKKKEETDFIVSNDKFIPFLLLYSLVHVQVNILSIVFLEDQKVRSTEMN